MKMQNTDQHTKEHLLGIQILLKVESSFVLDFLEQELFSLSGN
jgi:glycine cleavage system regulatory protein